MANIESRQIGKTALRVTSLGFGGAPLGNLYQPMNDATAAETVDAALSADIRYFDTAPFYGHGLSEHRLGQALRSQQRDAFVVSTKVGRLLRPEDPACVDPGLFPGCLPFRPVFDYSYDGVMRSIEDSLQRLGLHRIDLVLIHDLALDTHHSQEITDKYFGELMDGGYAALDTLRREGVISAIGAGLNEWQACQRLAEAGDFDCFLLAGRYTLLEQDALDSFLPLCERDQISIIIGGPYNTGILATGAIDGAYYNYEPAPTAVLDKVRRIDAVCQHHDVSIAAAALQFVLHHPCVASVIPGASSAAEVQRNLATFKAPVPDALWAELKTAGLLRNDAPTP